MFGTKIYKSEFLKIDYNSKSNLFIQTWLLSPNTIDEFKHEMLEYTKLYKTYKPKHTLWIQQNFKIDIDDTTAFWIEKNVNEPCFNYGNEKCAFVVSSDVLIHLKTIEAFEKADSCINAKHFASINDAKEWLKNKNIENNTDTKIIYDGVDDAGNLILKIPSNNIKHTLKNVRKSVEEELFINNHKEKIELLTKREKEILNLIAKDKKYQEVASELFISEHTVHSHWKKIKTKLNFKSKSEIRLFSKMFNNY